MLEKELIVFVVEMTRRIAVCALTILYLLVAGAIWLTLFLTLPDPVTDADRTIIIVAFVVGPLLGPIAIGIASFGCFVGVYILYKQFKVYAESSVRHDSIRSYYL
jgi:hypothetical protein